MSPFYRTLPAVPGFGVETTSEEVGLGVVGAVAALTAAHAVGSVVRQRRANARQQVVGQVATIESATAPVAVAAAPATALTGDAHVVVAPTESAAKTVAPPQDEGDAGQA